MERSHTSTKSADVQEVARYPIQIPFSRNPVSGGSRGNIRGVSRFSFLDVQNVRKELERILQSPRGMQSCDSTFGPVTAASFSFSRYGRRPGASYGTGPPRRNRDNSIGLLKHQEVARLALALPPCLEDGRRTESRAQLAQHHHGSRIQNSISSLYDSQRQDDTDVTAFFGSHPRGGITRDPAHSVVGDVDRVAHFR